MQKLRQGEDEISPTRGILKTLKPYQEAGVLSEPDWAYILACIRDTECCQAMKCLQCEERRLIESL